jgi:hypothetical protein
VDNSVTATTNIRIALPTSATTTLEFDDTVSSVSLGGTAAGSVNSSVSYEATNTVAVLSVASDLAIEDTLTIAGLRLDTSTTAGAGGPLSLYLDSDTAGEPAATTANSITVTGSLTQSDHADGQADDQFSFQSTDTATIFAFSLIVAEEDMQIASTTFLLDGHTDALSMLELYRDNNSDGMYDVDDTLIAHSGSFSGNVLTFNDDFTATTTHDYILVADVANVSLGTTLQVSLLDMAVTGVTSEKTVTLLGEVPALEHKRSGGGGSGGVRVSTQGQLGADVPTSTVTVIGGGGDGGDSLDPDSGDSLVLSTGYYAPATTGGTVSGWTNGTNAYVSNGSYVTAGSDGLQQSYSDFGMSIPDGDEITGVTVTFEANSTAATGSLAVALSWDGGATFTTAQAANIATTTDTIYTLGGESDAWGRTWSETDFSNANFVLRVTSNQTGATTHQLDTIQVRPHHQATGGSGGGGGALGWLLPERWLQVWEQLEPARSMANVIFGL